MRNYDAAHFDPPAPIARVTLRNPHDGATIADVPLLLDTGADITLLPRPHVVLLMDGPGQQWSEHLRGVADMGINQEA